LQGGESELKKKSAMIGGMNKEQTNIILLPSEGSNEYIKFS